jgi:hypothetical protein
MRRVIAGIRPMATGAGGLFVVAASAEEFVLAGTGRSEIQPRPGEPSFPDGFSPWVRRPARGASGPWGPTPLAGASKTGKVWQKARSRRSAAEINLHLTRVPSGLEPGRGTIRRRSRSTNRPTCR